MSDSVSDAVRWLEVVDARIEEGTAGPVRSLAPGRGRATPLAQLGRALLTGGEGPAFANAFGRGLGALALAQLDAFPGNLFWDLDFVAATLLAQGREAADPAADLDARFGLMAELQHLYGRHTPIGFSYVHDFTYGFDWAKWVGREPKQDGSVGPFDWDFLIYMRERAHELLDLIGRGDRKYPKLPPGEARNPFPFSRAPEAELLLFPELAQRGLVPVETWRMDAEPDCARPYHQLRVEVARELGL